MDRSSEPSPGFDSCDSCDSWLPLLLDELSRVQLPFIPLPGIPLPCRSRVEGRRETGQIKESRGSRVNWHEPVSLSFISLPVLAET